MESIEGEKRARGRSGRVTKYLVKWVGYTEPTWEPVRNLANCKDKISEFKARATAKVRVATKGHTVGVGEDGDSAAGAEDVSDGGKGAHEDPHGEADGQQHDNELEDEEFIINDNEFEDEEIIVNDSGEKRLNRDYDLEDIDLVEFTEREQRDMGRMPLVPVAADAGRGTASDSVSIFARLPVGVASSVIGAEGDVSSPSGCSNEDDRDRAHVARSVLAKTSTGVEDWSRSSRGQRVRYSNVHLLDSDDETKSEAHDEIGGVAMPSSTADKESDLGNASKPRNSGKTKTVPPVTLKTVLPKTVMRKKKNASGLSATVRTEPVAAISAAVETSGDFLDSDGDDDEVCQDDDGIDTIIEVERESDEDGEDAEFENLDGVAVADDTEFLPNSELRTIAESGWISTYYGTDRCKAYEATDLFDAESRLTADAVSAAKSMSPIDIFFFMMPKSLWRDITTETNRYEQQTRPARLAKAKRLNDNLPASVSQVRYTAARQKIMSFVPITPVEILQVMGLFIARSMCPHRLGLEQHWSTTSNGAIPAGTWSSIMPRQRFRDIFRFIHFSDNADVRAKQDRAWKIRPVVDVLQDRFQKGLHMGRWVAFDEMVIPSKSSRNAIRIYLKNKPHKYGTKLFAACCGVTKYCVRIEVYLGSKQDTRHVDSYAGARAVIRAVQALWPNRAANLRQKRVIVTDREYTCVSLMERLLQMGFYGIGTALPKRLGYPKHILFPFKGDPPKRYGGKRGMCTLVRCVEHSDIHACAWLDRKPVYFLASGVSTCKSSVNRKLKDGASTEVACPEFVADYNTYMGGVDTHDQLRLQRYSVQRSVRFAKYYKMLFLGLFDMALVNSYIVHREYCRSVGEKALSHAKFRIRLHEQLLEMTQAKFANVRPRNVAGDAQVCSPGFSATVTTHTIMLSNDKKPSGGTRFRVCKVCSILHSQVPKELTAETTTAVPTTRWYCKECSNEKTRVYLCNTVQRDDVGNQLTCFQTWHQVWNNGLNRFDGSMIRMRNHSDPPPSPFPASVINTTPAPSGPNWTPGSSTFTPRSVDTPSSSYSTDYY